jgi:hypothetical protein
VGWVSAGYAMVPLVLISMLSCLLTKFVE